MSRRFALALACSVITLAPLTLRAQIPSINLPDASPAATLTQDLGPTKLTVTYSRPGVKGRTIWGDLVKYGEVWRAGANENTTVEFSSDVTVNGQPLAAGKYGFHLIPTQSKWTAIFSKQNRAWGSYAYDQKQDALRVDVTPEMKSDSVERLTFTFDDVTDDTATLAMRWEKVRVPLQVKIDLPKVTLADIREQLTGLPQFGWQGWAQAASFSARNGGDLNEAKEWAEKALSMERNFNTLRVRALVAEKQGDMTTATSLRADALKVASPQERAGLARQLVGQKKYDEAIATVKSSTDAAGYEVLADAYAQKRINDSLAKLK